MPNSHVRTAPARARVPTPSAPGFTLVEVIVLLVIIASLTALAYSFMVPFAARVQAAFARSDIERQLLELPQRVRLSGHGGILASQSGDDLPEGAIIDVEGVPPGAGLEAWQVLRMTLPDGWRLRVDKPIVYHLSGSCEGGEVILARPPEMVGYELVAPLCRPARADAGARG
jgi:prepilin-type N-terminal cleavage/methylation domain-containing protein